MKKLEDDDKMPWGKYKGTLMGDVPAEYLLYMFDKGLNTSPVKTYIIENKKLLETEVSGNAAKYSFNKGRS